MHLSLECIKISSSVDEAKLKGFKIDPSPRSCSIRTFHQSFPRHCSGNGGDAAQDGHFNKRERTPRFLLCPPRCQWRVGRQRSAHAGAFGRPGIVCAQLVQSDKDGRRRRRGCESSGLWRITFAGYHCCFACVHEPQAAFGLRGQPRPPRRNRWRAPGLDAAVCYPVSRRGRGHSSVSSNQSRKVKLARNAEVANGSAVSHAGHRRQPCRPAGSRRRQPSRHCGAKAIGNDARPQVGRAFHE